MSDLRQPLFDVSTWLVHEARNAEKADQPEAALKLLQAATSLLIRQNERLVDPRIESTLQRLSALIHGSSTGAILGSRPVDAPRLLHVLNESLGHGGHTAMAVRWMEVDSSCRHDMALTRQLAPVPEKVRAALAKAGGQLFQCDVDASLSARARWLRGLAQQGYSAIVLHVAADDVIAATAFGVPGGPPVMLVNHAAHIYWVGAGHVDLVLNCRGSALERYWTTRYRGIPRCATVPIPLTANALAATSDIRARFGIAPDAILIITSGETFKVQASRTHDFVKVGASILEALPNAHLLAIGIEPDRRWDSLSADVKARFRAIGRQSDVGAFLAAADVYIEGFPFGSTTALLEAGLTGLPCVLAPGDCPPPYGSDGIATDDVLTRPANVDEYARQVIALATSKDARRELSSRLAAAIRSHHTAPLWNEHVKRAMEALPAEHRVYEILPADPVPVAIADYWSEFRARSGHPPTSTAVLAAEQIQSLAASKVVLKLPIAMLDLSGSLRSGRVVRFLASVLLYLSFSVFRPLLSKGFLDRLVRDMRWYENPMSRLGRVTGRMSFRQSA